MGTIVVVTVLAVFAPLAVGALAFQVWGLSGRLRKLGQGREVERRHREALTAQVERLDHAAGRSPQPDGEVVGVTVKKVDPRFPQQPWPTR